MKIIKLIALLIIFHFSFSSVKAQPTWVVSGAPIGDTSTYLYPFGGWSGSNQLLLVNPLTQDSFRVFNSTGVPDGIHIYGVSRAPNAICGSTGIGTNNRYFGIFVVNGTSPTYSMSYHYAGNPAVTPAIEPNLELAERLTNADTTCAAWTNMGATLDVVGDSLYKTTQSGRKEIILTTTSTPLPIELLSFTAIEENESVKTSWTTASEINNDYFTVLRSKDAISFEQIGTVSGAGNSNSILNYVFYDDNPFLGTSYYQLKQTDFNGDYSFSNIVAVNRNNLNMTNIYPNPAKDMVQVMIGLSSASEITINVYNTLGQEVLSEHRQIEKGESTITVSINHLIKGIYTFKVNTSLGMCISKSFIKNEN